MLDSSIIIVIILTSVSGQSELCFIFGDTQLNNGTKFEFLRNILSIYEYKVWQQGQTQFQKDLAFHLIGIKI